MPANDLPESLRGELDKLNQSSADAAPSAKGDYSHVWGYIEASATALTVQELSGPVLALVPHADDETLGCGGLLGAMFEDGLEVHMVLVTDGAASHPNAVNFGRSRRVEVREAEFKAAVGALGGSSATLQFWRQPDSKLPLLDVDTRALATTELAGILTARDYQTILTPWRRDPHGDHQITTELLHAAADRWGIQARVLEYCVWLGHQGDAKCFPKEGEVAIRSFKVSERLVARKRQALSAHQSQLGRVFDDPEGFIIPDALARSVERPMEYYLEEPPPGYQTVANS